MWKPAPSACAAARRSDPDVTSRHVDDHRGRLHRGQVGIVEFAHELEVLVGRQGKGEQLRGAGANKRRPAVIVSNDGANTTAQQLGHGVITVVPITSNTERVYPFQVLLPTAATGLDRDSKAQAEQIRSIAVERVGARVGVVPAEQLASIDEAIRLHLAL